MLLPEAYCLPCEVEGWLFCVHGYYPDAVVSVVSPGWSYICCYFVLTRLLLFDGSLMLLPRILLSHINIRGDYGQFLASALLQLWL